MIFSVRVSRSKQFANYICTSSVLECDKFNKEKFPNKNKQGAEKNEKKSLTSQRKVVFMDSDPKKKLQNTVEKKKTQTGKQVPRIKFDPFRNPASLLAKNVAEELGGDKKKITKELLSSFDSLQVTDDGMGKSMMKKSSIPSNFSLQKHSYQLQRRSSSKSTSLGIFKIDIMKEIKNQIKLKIWNELEVEELAFQSKCAPKNYFEELINWTNEGKLWHFPIDNDQGMEEEAKISFSEHIFLEKYLEPWCPRKGPLRRFMELVLIGLSKNPYLTLEEKKSHIDWFRKYFDEKKKLLQELGAVGPPKEIGAPKEEESS